MKAIKNKRSSGSGEIASELSVIASKENIWIDTYYNQLMTVWNKTRYQSSRKNRMWHHYIKKEIEKIPQITGQLISIVSLVDCLPRLFTLNCRKSQSTLLA